MATSLFQLLKIGIGPSSSHTVGPMVAAKRFIERITDAGLLPSTASISVELFGSLAHTGRGHGSDHAVMLGLMGSTPDTVDVDAVAARISEIRRTKSLPLSKDHAIVFDPKQHLIFNKRDTLPLHPNGMRFRAFDPAGDLLVSQDYYSVGGGFVVATDSAEHAIVPDHAPLPFPFHSADELLTQCRTHGMSIADLMFQNELYWRGADDIRRNIDQLWQVMKNCVARGLTQSGTLPGPLRLNRRAPELYAKLQSRGDAPSGDPLSVLDWVNVYALAVSEENAAGGRMVTAPTNGAAGIIPAVGMYYEQFVPGADARGIERYLLTAGAIGLLYKENASISGAEVGCQGEIGVACSMAAGGLVAAQGGSPEQVENAAEIAMEHHLGLTCDPVGGLVQIPCIERNAMGAVKAINAARMALHGDGHHKVSLDEVIETMRQTGADMNSKYKETSRGGLAVNVVEC